MITSVFEILLKIILNLYWY